MATTVTTEPTTTTISPCGYPPALLNGEIVRITSSTAEYGCQTGFVMSGSKVIMCSGNTWATNLPSCAVIDQRSIVNVFEDWWLYFVAAFLAFIALILLLFFIWCCCCGPHSAKVWPAHSSGHGQSVCCNSCRKSGPPEVAYNENHAANLIDLEENVYFVPVRTGYSEPLEKKLPNGTVLSAESIHQTPRSEGQLRFMRVVQEVVEEDRNRKKAKTVNQWMPHSHPVRKINTSTK